jgi:hypothetical protein
MTAVCPAPQAIQEPLCVDLPTLVWLDRGVDLPSLVSNTLHGYLRNADAALPGLIEMLYVTGSTALGARQPLAEQIRREATGMPEDGPVPGEHVAWMMLGPARLHYTLAYQAIVSKQGAATYLGRGFPQWRVLAERAARWHAGQDETFTLADLRASAAATDAVIDDAHARYGGA